MKDYAIQHIHNRTRFTRRLEAVEAFILYRAVPVLFVLLVVDFVVKYFRG